ncbi:MAG: FtsW/RodA/SpoVE family cell cycle protein [Patescibacteria group bacterium]|jgi:cell division protein FtsW
MKVKKVRAHSGKSPPVDKTLLLYIFGLLIFGVVMIYDATVAVAQSNFGGPYKFLFHHLAWVLLGLLGFFFFMNYNYKHLGKISYFLFFLSLLLLLVPAIIGFFDIVGVLNCEKSLSFVPCVNGAYRWVYLNPPPFPEIPFLGVLGFQPAEFAKLALVIYLSVQIGIKAKEKMTPFWLFLVATGIVSFLVLLQPNMSTAVLIFLIGVFIYFSSGLTLYPLMATLPMIGILGGGAVLSSPYRRQRLLTLIGMSEGDDLSLGYHIRQILIALGSGGLLGVGFGQSRQKYQYLPEVSADSIFAIIGEELGFIGTTALVVLFGFFIIKGFDIAKNAPDLPGKMLAVGITSWIGLQFFINVAAMTKLIPLTGIPIPLISYGGSSTVFSLMGLGILANVSRYSKA